MENTNNKRVDELEKGTQKLFKIVFERLDQLEINTPPLPKERKRIGINRNKKMLVGILEETGGFEPPALRFCKPFHWTSLARLLRIQWTLIFTYL